MIYTNLLGITCFTESNNIIKYDDKILELFKDSISCDFYKVPIVQFRFPQNIYDLKVLTHWYSQSDKEPLLGMTIEDANPYFVMIDIIYAMTLLEYKDEELLFHQPNIDLINYKNIVREAFKNNYKMKENKKLLDTKLLYLDLKYYLRKYDSNSIIGNYYTDFTGYDTSNCKNKSYGCINMPNNKIPFKDYTSFTLEDILINDEETGKRIDLPILKNGSFKQKTKKESEFDDSILFNKILEYFPNNSVFIEKKISQ